MVYRTKPSVIKLNLSETLSSITLEIETKGKTFQCKSFFRRGVSGIQREFNIGYCLRVLILFLGMQPLVCICKLLPAVASRISFIRRLNSLIVAYLHRQVTLHSRGQTTLHFLEMMQSTF